jgi:hypothetical protein
VEPLVRVQIPIETPKLFKMTEGENINPDLESRKIQADIQISAIIQNIYMLGANDHEFSTIEDIRQKMKSGVITPEQAVAEAKKIENAKMDYH